MRDDNKIMLVELIIIIICLAILFLVYGARIRSKGNKGLFSENFIQKADEKIFEFIKFIFKLYSDSLKNITGFVSKIPHRIVQGIHFISHKIAQKSSEWIEKITHKHSK